MGNIKSQIQASKKSINLATKIQGKQFKNPRKSKAQNDEGTS